MSSKKITEFFKRQNTIATPMSDLSSNSVSVNSLSDKSVTSNLIVEENSRNDEESQLAITNVSIITIFFKIY